MAWDDIPRTHSFSLGDFHDFDRCPFLFFVSHHLEKKYEIEEGSPNQAVGSLLDLTIKKLHQSKAYGQPVEYLQNLVKAAENEMREKVLKSGPNSFYGPQIPFLIPEVIQKAKDVFQKYHQGIAGKYKRSLSYKTFWDLIIPSDQPLKLWGGPDSVEMGEDGLPEVIDYKYYEDNEKGKEGLDMDLMPKVYTLLCASELLKFGYKKARFKVKFWQEPENGAFYEEFDLSLTGNFEEFFKDKIERILRTKELSFCEREYCKACKSPQREEWIKQLKDKGYINQ